MEVLYPRCCGLDVHKSSITACVLLAQSGKPLKHIRRRPVSDGMLYAPKLSTRSKRKR
jgi:hypothetical protein